MRTPHLRTALTSAEVAQALTEAAALIETQRAQLEAQEAELVLRRSAGDTARKEMERQHKEIKTLRDGWNKEREQTLKLEAKIRELEGIQAERADRENIAYGRLLDSWHEEHSAKLEVQKEARTQAGQLQTCRETIKNLRAMNASADKTIRELQTEIQNHELGGM